MRARTTIGVGLSSVPHGLPEDRPQFDLSRYFKVIQRESSIKEETVNDRIQREGAQYYGGGSPDQPLTGSEAEWYMSHKGYSERI